MSETIGQSSVRSDHLPRERQWGGRSLVWISGVAVLGILACQPPSGPPSETPREIRVGESHAIAALKQVGNAQFTVHEDGMRERPDEIAGYALLGELAGAVPVRWGEVVEPIDPPLLSPRFAHVGAAAGNGGGAVVAQDYIFQLWLPSKDGGWVAEWMCGGRRPGSVDDGAARMRWLCYAWPVEHGRTGNRAFLITHGGDVVTLGNDNARYSGARAPVPGISGIRPGPGVSPHDQGLPVAVGADDYLGDRWIVIG